MTNLLLSISNHFKLSFRRLSSFNNRSKTGIISLVTNDDNYTWSEINWSEYGKQFSKPIEFPLPGRIGVILNNNNNNKNSLSGAPTAAAKFESCTCISPTDPHSLDNPSNRKLVVDNLKSLLNDPLPHENQLIKIREATSAYTYLDRLDASGNMEASAENCFELKAHACPISLINDFKGYFRSQLPADTPLTVLTVSFKSQHDMATWSSEVECEREALIKKFVDTAQELCNELEKHGYWADFIDPSSGRPYKSPYSHATFYEIDDRYHQFGFEIVDYGCCKVISHRKWGTSTYVGCLLTNAAPAARLVQELMRKFNVE